MKQKKMRNGSSPARKLGQDLMRGEHVVGVPGGLTFTKGVPRTDEVSLKILDQSSGTSIFDPVLCELA
jgi:hypothetical protein